MAFKKSIDEEGYIIRLMNNSEYSANTKISIGSQNVELSFGKFEVKTVVYNGAFQEYFELKI